MVEDEVPQHGYLICTFYSISKVVRLLYNYKIILKQKGIQAIDIGSDITFVK